MRVIRPVFINYNSVHRHCFSSGGLPGESNLERCPNAEYCSSLNSTLWVGQSKNPSCIPGRDQRFSLAQSISTGLGAHPVTFSTSFIDHFHGEENRCVKLVIST